ncbi:hypothetical protein MBLNU457_5559t1 [Dothideomycetes sp. NU457]
MFAKKLPPSVAPDLSIQGDRVTLHPPITSSGPLPELPPTDGSAPDEPLLRSYARFRSAPFDALKEFSLHISGEGWRSYDTIVGQPIFYKGFSENMKRMVVENAILQAKIKELALKRIATEESEGRFLNSIGTGNDLDDKKQNRIREIERQLTEVAELWTDQMICKMESKRFIRGAYFLATQLLTRAYHQGVHVSSEEALRLRSVAAEAAKKNQSIIFLPCHRSHVDYVSLQLICYRLGLALPTVVAGDNLNFPVVGPFLQHAGAMWIRRSFGDDALYTTLVQSYMDTLLQNGFNIECFIEGGRSRTGKLLPPKFGILSYLLDSVLSGRVSDAIVCPVSTQYDKVIEVDSYISELLGQPKPKESLFAFLSSSSILSLKLGRVDVRFHEPWSMRKFIDSQTAITQISPSMPPSQDVTLRRRILSTLGYKVLSDINDASVVMPTALIGTVLLTLRGRGVGKAELVRRVDELCSRVRSRGGRVAHFGTQSTATVVERGLEVLGPNLVGMVDGLPEPTYYAVDRFQLSFYRNMTIHLFVSEALVCAALYTKVKQGGGAENQIISYQDLYDYVYFLSRLFRSEFIFPTTPLTENLSATLSALEDEGVLTVSTSPDGEKTITISATERRNGRENFDFYCFLIWPFIEATWLGAISLLMLTPPPNSNPSTPSLDLKAVQNAAQLLGKTLYAQGDLSYFEAVSKETLSKSFERVQEEGMIVVTKTKGVSGSRVRLGTEWIPARDENGEVVLEGSLLWSFCEEISRGRREGKNRRDGNTVRSRVLYLVQLVADRLWDGKSVDPAVETKGGRKGTSAPGPRL